MNLEQADALCSNTCGTIERMESAFEAMKANGMSKKDIEKEIRKLEYKDYEDFKNFTGIHGKTNQIKDPDFEKRSAASKKGWKTRRKNSDKK